MVGEDSGARFWERLYSEGGTSGTGSVGRLARFKAEVIQRLLAEHSVASVAELGCGDGRQLALIEYPDYTGLDVAPAAVELCRARFGDDPRKRFVLYEPRAPPFPAPSWRSRSR